MNQTDMEKGKVSTRAGEQVRTRAGEIGLASTSFAHMLDFPLSHLLKSHLPHYSA